MPTNPFERPKDVNGSQDSQTWRPFFAIGSACSTALAFVLGLCIERFVGPMSGKQFLQLFSGSFILSIIFGFFARKSVDAGILWFFFLCFLYLCGFFLFGVIGLMTGDIGR
jgi:hypothetical protein